MEVSMSRKNTSIIVMIVGAVLLVLSLAADSVGIGSYPGFHGTQIAGTVLGLVILIAGYFLGRVPQKK
jgi:hypothetical protein